MGRGKAQKTRVLLDAISDILSGTQPAAVRAVCYQLFVRGLLTKMSKAQANWVSTQFTWARENGMIPWSWIVERLDLEAWDEIDSLSSIRSIWPGISGQASKYEGRP